MGVNKLKIASCQFAVNGNIERNFSVIMEFIDRGAEGGADVIHFSECALSGYADFDFADISDIDIELLRDKTQRIMQRAAEKKIWVILGSTHFLTSPNRPHNSLYVIGPDGKIHDRYDKRFCTTQEVEFYTPGSRFVVFEINGVKCSVLICFDLRFPEIYRKLRSMGVECIFQSFYNARQKGPSVHSEIMRQSMQCRAATNYFWVSMTNSCGWYSPYPSIFIRPDGKIISQLDQHKDGMMINTVDTDKQYYDPSAPYRQMAIEGALSNGPGLINDPRSIETKQL